jgi:hypothetical protein
MVAKVIDIRMARHHALRAAVIPCFISFLVVWNVAPEPAPAAEGTEIKATHSPRQPKSGETVTVSISAPRSESASNLLLQYQIVEPGNYIALDDPAYARDWTQVSLEKSASEQASEDRTTLKATLPADLQKNRRLIRYRVYSKRSESVAAPAEEEAQQNFAYFVYDGIPEWRAAINPNGTGKEQEIVRFPPEVMRSVQAYHLISKPQSIANVTWREPMGLGHPERHDYKYTATLVADGKVYDHVRFRARGGTWRHAMGKNMWKIDFNKGHHLEARDNYQRKYETKWDKLNLGACIQQADYGMRGEHGMLEAMAYRLFNLTGVEAPHTHWVQLRIVDGAEENPANQYLGDFWGLYLATEEVDEDFLEEHGLPEGNVYKMEFGDAKPEHLTKDGPTDRSDVLQFMQGLNRNPDARWWRGNVDLPRYYSYRAIVECIHHYDIGTGKNYFYYHNPKARLWQVVPWDVDLTWSDHMYGDGAEPFFVTGLLRSDPFKREYEQRLAEIRDLLFNPDQCGALIEEYAAVISDPKGGLSMVDADRAKWDYHPIMSSQFSARGKADPGLFYRQSSTRDFRGMVQLMKRYVEERGKWVDGNLLAGAPTPATSKIASVGKLDLSAPKLRVQLDGGEQASQVKWRLAEVSNPNNSASIQRCIGKYEIDALWESTGGPSVEIPTKDLEAGHTYRIRARVLDESDQWARWSAPLEFTKSE